MKETQRENTEANKKRICRYGLEIKAQCRQCLFEALCHYQDNKWSDIHEAEQTFLELLYSKYYPMEEIYNGCLTLPEDLADARDYKAEATIELDYSIKLPNYLGWGVDLSVNYQWAYGSCTANSTSLSSSIM